MTLDKLHESRYGSRENPGGDDGGGKVIHAYH